MAAQLWIWSVVPISRVACATFSPLAMATSTRAALSQLISGDASPDQGPPDSPDGNRPAVPDDIHVQTTAGVGVRGDHDPVRHDPDIDDTPSPRDGHRLHQRTVGSFTSNPCRVTTRSARLTRSFCLPAVLLRGSRPCSRASAGQPRAPISRLNPHACFRN